MDRRNLQEVESVMRILIIEDEQKVASFIKRGLEEQNFEADVVNDGQAAETLALSRDYHVILLDIIIPGINGLELCQRIKAAKPDVPILMLTALGTTENKVNGFDSGADDYLLKPFEFAELVARIKALARRSPGESRPRSSLKVADLELDSNKKVAYRSGNTIPLTAKEFALLEYFMKNSGRVISRAELAEKVWDVTFDTGTNVVEVYINILRKKIDRDFDTKLLHTRVGLGYMFSPTA